MMISFNPAFTGINPTNNTSALVSYLNPNQNQTGATIVPTTQQALAFPSASNTATSFPSFASNVPITKGQSVFGGQPTGNNFQFGQPTTPQNFGLGAIPQTSSTGASNSLGFNLNDLAGLEQQATQVIGQAQQQQGLSASTGINPPSAAFRQASTTPQNIIVQLPKGFNASDLQQTPNDELSADTTEDPSEIKELQSSVEGLQEKVD
jgi:hypothetical protein